MENASKALLIAGAVLIAMMVLSLGVYFARMMADENARIYEQLEDSRRTEFNQQFINFSNEKKLSLDKDDAYSYSNVSIDARDIATLIYLAKDSNNSNQLTDSDESNTTSRYITVEVKQSIYEFKDGSGNNKNNHVEQMENAGITKFLNDKANAIDQYKCTIEINENNGYVNKIKIE
ncbi:MAG: hypothetical protein HFJ17_04690 [Clostridia bacterium]|nr:hypothetical protein [Clostridia bacterium]